MRHHRLHLLRVGRAVGGMALLAAMLWAAACGSDDDFDANSGPGVERRRLTRG